MNRKIQELAVKSAHELKAISTNCLDGFDPIHATSRFLDVPPEDVLIELLKFNLEKDNRIAVIDACREAFGEVFKELAVAKPSQKTTEKIKRLCRVANLAAPSELTQLVHAAFVLTTNNHEDVEEIQLAAASALLGYEQDPTFLPVWEKAIQQEVLAAYAFNGISKIDSSGIILEKYLKFLWEKVLCENWKTNVLAITKKLFITGKEKFVHNLINHFRSANIWDKFSKKMSETTWGNKLLERPVQTLVQERLWGSPHAQIKLWDEPLISRPVFHLHPILSDFDVDNEAVYNTNIFITDLEDSTLPNIRKIVSSQYRTSFISREPQEDWTRIIVENKDEKRLYN